MRNFFSEEDEDSFGPGTDLVLSIFAVLMILIALGVNHYSSELDELYTERKNFILNINNLKDEKKSLEEDIVKNSIFIDKINELKINIDKLKIEKGLLKNENNKLKISNEEIIKKIEIIKVNNLTLRNESLELAALKDIVEILKKDNETLKTSSEKLSRDFKVTSLALESEKLDLLALKNRVIFLINDNKKLQESENRLILGYKEINNEKNEIEAKYVALQKKSKILFTIQEGRGYENFDPNKSVLKMSAKVEIRGSIRKILSSFGQANQIEVIGYASAEPYLEKISIDKNLDLSAARAVSVAHYLTSLGVPYQCISARGVGRSRSQHLSSWLLANNRSLKDWDDLWRDDGIRPIMKSKHENKLSKERRIEIRAVYDEESKCLYKGKL